MKRMMLIVVVLVAFALALGVAGAALATGQPGQSCQSEPSSPGNASSAPGSAFNEDPGGVAGAVYAGNQAVNSKNPLSVSQYDVACYQVSNNPGH